jgi:hypothetical protein
MSTQHTSSQETYRRSYKIKSDGWCVEFEEMIQFSYNSQPLTNQEAARKDKKTTPHKGGKADKKVGTKKGDKQKKCFWKVSKSREVILIGFLIIVIVGIVSNPSIDAELFTTILMEFYRMLIHR